VYLGFSFCLHSDAISQGFDELSRLPAVKRDLSHVSLKDRAAKKAMIALRLDRVGEIEEAAGVYAETKIEELVERKLRFDHPELAQQWDKIQRREREASIPK
jgi:hypothetical protein